MRAILLSILLIGCEEKLGGSEWGSEVSPIENTDTISGDLSEGAILDSLDWADDSAVACWPGTEDLNWTGNHVLYSTTQPPNTLLTATVTPDNADVDVNVYILQQGGSAYQVPPDVTSAVTCEAGYNQSTDSNPGEEESAATTATTNGYNILIGVAGPEGVTSGGYSLSLTLEDY